MVRHDGESLGRGYTRPMPTVLPEGYELDDGIVVQAALDGSDLRRCRWLLQTTGSQTLYERFGFASLTDGRVMRWPAPS